jgi:hypothetical protein
MRAPMTLDIFSFCFPLHVLLYSFIANNEREGKEESEKDRKTERIYKRESFSERFWFSK